MFCVNLARRVRLLSIKKGNENISISFDACRDDKIWACDLRSPRPLRYRAAPHPVVGMCLQEETRSASLACRHSSSILEATSFSDVFQRIYCIRNSSFQGFAIVRFISSNLCERFWTRLQRYCFFLDWPNILRKTCKYPEKRYNACGFTSIGM